MASQVLTDPRSANGWWGGGGGRRTASATGDPGLVPLRWVVHDCLHADHALPLLAVDVCVFVLFCLAAFIPRTPRTIGVWAFPAPT